jgi:hypothetical protein
VALLLEKEERTELREMEERMEWRGRDERMEWRDKDERMERRDRDERMERRELQDLVERKDFIERTDAGRGCWGFGKRPELGLGILPQQVHGSSFAGMLTRCMLGMLTREAVLIGLAKRIPSPHGGIVVEAGIDALTEPPLT